MCGGGDFWGPVSQVLPFLGSAAFGAAAPLADLATAGAEAATIGTTLGDVGLDAGALTGAGASTVGTTIGDVGLDAGALSGTSGSSVGSTIGNVGLDPGALKGSGGTDIGTTLGDVGLDAGALSGTGGSIPAPAGGITPGVGESGAGLNTVPGSTQTPTPTAALQPTPGSLPSGSSGPLNNPFLDTGAGLNQAQADASAGLGGDATAYGGSTPTGTPATPDAGGGFTGTLKAALPYMQAGGAIGSIASNIMGGVEASKANSIQMQALKDAESANTMRLQNAAPAAAYGASQLATATAGNLTASQQASLDTWTTNQKSAIHQKLANMGLLNSTMIAQWDAWVDQQALAQKQSMVDQTAQEGINAVGTASGAAPSGAQPASAGTLTDSLSSANQTLAQLAAMGT